MIKITDKENCCGCHNCALVCPKNCITMKEDEEGFLYPVVDEDKCVDCGICEKSCPIISPLNNNKKLNDITSYAAYSKNNDIRLNSSSGGMFTHLASLVINASGVVFGAAFDDKFGVHHICVDNIDNLDKLRGSKYLQSIVGNSFKEAEEYLKKGRKVYFSGTPCQISALLKYLKKDYDNLITQDFICHGVPSPKIWKYYIKYQENLNNSKIENAGFRNKAEGWNDFSLFFDFANSTKYISDLSNDTYMKVFLSNYCLRPSCYNCSFKTMTRPSDITLADFWGIQNVMPEMDDDKGTSLLCINSNKGKMLFDEIKNDIVYKTTSIKDVVKFNPSMIQSSTLPPKRDYFMQNISENNFDKITKKLFKVSFYKKAKIKLKRFLKRFIVKRRTI